MEMNLNEMKLALEGLERINDEMVDPMKDKATFKIQCAKKDALCDLRSKLFFAIKRAEEEQSKNNMNDNFSKIWNHA
jgi:hypothetical protein